MTWLHGVPRPDHGQGFRQILCPTCGAGWVGHERDGDWCPWCEAAAARHRALERRLLLDPPWLASDVGSARYDALGDADKAVWDRTRGQRRNVDSVEVWTARLARAVEAGVITQAEAYSALDRYDRRGTRAQRPRDVR